MVYPGFPSFVSLTFRVARLLLFYLLVELKIIAIVRDRDFARLTRGGHTRLTELTI